MKKTKLLLVLSLVGLIGTTSFLPTSSLVNRTSSRLTDNIKKAGRFNVVSKQDSLNAIGEIVLEEISKYSPTQDYEIRRISEMTDFDNNTYVLVEFNPIGYAVYNLTNGDVVECAPTSVSPYKDSRSKNLYYLPYVGYFYKENDVLVNLVSKQEVNELEINAYSKHSKKLNAEALTNLNEKNINRTYRGVKRSKVRVKRSSDIDYVLNTTIIYSDYEVDKSWFFKRNDCEYPEIDSNACGYTAVALLLSYNEIFKSTGYFSPAQAAQYITKYQGPDFGLDVPKVDNSFIYELSSNPGSSSIYTLKNTINNFMAGKIRRYSLVESHTGYIDIEGPIDDGFPVMYAGILPELNGGTINHAVVVYGYYDNGKILCHYGRRNYTQVIMSRVGFFNETGTLAIYNNSVHAHNTYFILNNLTYCGCGQYITC